MNFQHTSRVTEIEERVKALSKILSRGAVWTDQDSWIFRLDSVLEDLKQFLKLDVTPEEMIPRTQCIGIINHFRTLGIDYDEVPEQGMCLYDLILKINSGVGPSEKLTMKNEYFYQGFAYLGTPNANGRCYPQEALEKAMRNSHEIKGTHHQPGQFMDLKDFWPDNVKSFTGKGVSPQDIPFSISDLQDINIEDAYPKPGESAHSFGELDDGYPITQHYYSGVAITDNIIHDVYPDMIYPEEQLKLYTERPWLTPEEAASAGIVVRLDGNPLHPRHWRYAAGNGLIVFLDNKIDSGRVEVEADVLSGSIALRFLPKWMREGKYGAFDRFVNAYALPEEYLNVLQADIDAGKIKVCIVGPKSNVYNSWRDAIKKQLEGNTDVILIDSLPADIFKNGINRGIAVDGIETVQMLERANYAAFAKQAQGYFEREPVPNEPTVKGNSRQAIIDNGKRTWPASRNKKGHRRHSK